MKMTSESMVGEVLGLFAQTEVFIFVFMEIATKIPTIQRVILRRGTWTDKFVFAILFGGFSILGTYLGTPLPSGAIVNIRDLGPMIAGLAAGPVVGLGAGLIGGIHRFFMGGFTCVTCGLATVIAGLIGGLVYYFNKNKIIGILPSMLVAVMVELVHGGLGLLARPFNEALEAVKAAIPDMMIANALGSAISIIVLHNTKGSREVPDDASGLQNQQVEPAE